MTYAYDAIGNRIQRQAWDGVSSTTQRYGFDGWDTSKPSPIGNENFDVWAELDGSNDLVVRRVWGTGFDEVIARQSALGTVSWYQADRQGSVRQIFDNAGSILSAATYSAYGAITSGSLLDGIGYTGQVHDALTGFIIMGEGIRQYDPATGRFLAEDPIRFAAGDPNLSRYVGNGPTNATDPSGNWLFADPVHAGGVMNLLAQAGVQYDTFYFGPEWNMPITGRSDPAVANRIGFVIAPTPENIERVRGIAAAHSGSEGYAAIVSALLSVGPNGPNVLDRGAHTAPMPAISMAANDELMRVKARLTDRANFTDNFANQETYNPVTAALTGIGNGLVNTPVNLAIGVGNTAYEVVAIGVDLGQTGISAVLLGLTDNAYNFNLYSSLVGGYDQAVAAGNGTSYQWTAFGNMASFGAIPLWNSLDQSITSLDPTAFQQTLGSWLAGYVLGNSLASGRPGNSGQSPGGGGGVAPPRSPGGGGGVARPGNSGGGTSTGYTGTISLGVLRFTIPAEILAGVQACVSGVIQVFMVPVPGTVAGAVSGGVAAGLGSPHVGTATQTQTAPHPQPQPHGPGPLAATQTQENHTKPCFAAGTPLRTPEGWKYIEDFKPGDFVLSRDEHDPTGDVFAKVVEEVFVNAGLVWHLHAGGQVIRTAAEHPFFAAGRGWVNCNELTVGDLLLCADGTWVAVEDLHDTGVWEVLYNLRVADFHTYFVGCDEWGFSVWAHNKCWYHGTDSANAALIIANGLNEQGFVGANPNDIRGVFVETNSDTAGDYARLVTFERNNATKPKGKLKPVILVADDKDIGKYLELVPGAIEGEKYIPVKNFPLVPKTAFKLSGIDPN